MGGFQWKAIDVIGAALGAAFMLAHSAAAQSQTATPMGRPHQVTIAYIPADALVLQQVYDLLRDRRALERVQEMLSPFRLPEELVIKTTECSEVNSRYRRESFKPTVTICYEYLRHILESLPNETTPAGITAADAAAGQFFWATFHEVGHAMFDMFRVPIFGHPEDAADNFATYLLLQFGRGQAPRLIGGAAWAWRAYLGDYKRNPVVRRRIADFANDHGLPEQRFYNLLCLAFGADPVQFAEANSYLPPTRLSNCKFEYVTLVNAFHKEISPHIDLEIARRVFDTNWLADAKSAPAPAK